MTLTPGGYSDLRWHLCACQNFETDPLICKNCRAGGKFLPFSTHLYGKFFKFSALRADFDPVIWNFWLKTHTHVEEMGFQTHPYVRHIPLLTGHMYHFLLKYPPGTYHEWFYKDFQWHTCKNCRERLLGDSKCYKEPAEIVMHHYKAIFCELIPWQLLLTYETSGISHDCFCDDIWWLTGPSQISLWQILANYRSRSNSRQGFRGDYLWITVPPKMSMNGSVLTLLNSHIRDNWQRDNLGWIDTLFWWN